MKKSKVIELIKEELENEKTTIKLKPQDLQIGDVLFCYNTNHLDYLHLYKRPIHIIKKECNTFPTYTKTITKGAVFGNDMQVNYEENFDYYISNKDILNYGIDICILESLFKKIDYDYYNKYLESCKVIDDLKTVKDIKEYLKTIL